MPEQWNASSIIFRHRIIEGAETIFSYGRKPSGGPVSADSQHNNRTRPGVAWGSLSNQGQALDSILKVVPA